MRKILLALDAQKINHPAIDFACYLALLSKSSLTGVFLENTLSEEIREPVFVSTGGRAKLTAEEKKERVEENIKQFKETCENRGVHALIHRKRGVPAEEIIDESRFADLIVMDPETSFKNKIETTPSSFVKKILEEAECPILLNPFNFESVDEIVFTYNSGRSSMFAIRQFSYLFPELHRKKITVVEVNKQNEIGIRAKPKLSEWLKMYYSEVDFQLLSGDPGEELFKYFLEKKGLLLVMGAYGRGILSTMFKNSRADLLVKTANLPIFITHH
jgi:nucleotide-binding universal stress UspA family protein